VENSSITSFCSNVAPISENLPAMVEAAVPIACMVLAAMLLFIPLFRYKVALQARTL
jgi:hypothetical protein